MACGTFDFTCERPQFRGPAKISGEENHAAQTLGQKIAQFARYVTAVEAYN
jgi:hypothetical protein